MAASSSKRAETILLVDDDPEVLGVAAEILRAEGYAVLSTRDPREALRIARTRAEPLHLLLTDVVMPLMSIAHRFHGHASVEMNRVPIDLVLRSTR